jgi:DNA-binding CsgD family transcriptional regulator
MISYSVLTLAEQKICEAFYQFDGDIWAIANNLQMSDGTVKNHLGNIYLKLKIGGDLVSMPGRPSIRLIKYLSQQRVAGRMKGGA